jgi:hypothetical protein
MTGPGLRILYLATKPAFPPSDGGKLLMWNTLKELAARGHRITFVAPGQAENGRENNEAAAQYCTPRLVGCHPGSLLVSFIRAQIVRKPLSVVRHTHTALRQAVRDELSKRQYDVIHLEQVQSLFNLPQGIALPPLVLRAQNVESQLWRMVSRIRPRLAWIARNEARKMSAVEARAVRRVRSTIALTRPDGNALAGAGGLEARRIRIIPPPFPNSLPGSGERFEGDPPIILLGGGWLPNRDSVVWFLASIWDDVRAANPAAHLHVFGGTRPTGVRAASWHPSPTDSRLLFPDNAILVVPLRVASGIRMKIIEAWARGTPVVATPQAVAGLDVEHAQEALLARTGEEFAAAINSVHSDPDLRSEIILRGRRVLSSRLDPTRIGGLLEATYREATTSASALV